jgi:thioredoxin reductase (NADPH)
LTEGDDGLAAAVYGASEGLDVVVVEDVAIGGQAGSSSRIENYLGFYRGVSGVELARAAMLQAVKFGTRLVSPRSVTGLSQGPGEFRVRLDDEHDVVASAVIIASGVRYRRLDLLGLADLEGRGVYYAASQLEAKVVSGRNAVVVGGANSAGQAALFLARHAGQVHVLIRRDDLRDTMSNYLAQRRSARRGRCLPDDRRGPLYDLAGRGGRRARREGFRGHRRRLRDLGSGTVRRR